MIDFTIFDQRGKILRSGSAAESQINLQLGNAEFVLCEASDPDTQYVIDGYVIDLPTRPSAHHDFDYEISRWVIDEARAWKAVRLMRDELMSATDWRVARAAEQGESLNAEWKFYRQALRDITVQPDPCNIQWPVAPKEEA